MNNRLGVQLHNHVLARVTKSARLTRPLVIRNNDYDIGRGEGQFIAMYPPLAFPSPIDDLRARWLEPNVATTEVLRDKIKIAVGRVITGRSPRSKSSSSNISPSGELSRYPPRVIPVSPIGGLRGSAAGDACGLDADEFRQTANVGRFVELAIENMGVIGGTGQSLVVDQIRDARAGMSVNPGAQRLRSRCGPGPSRRFGANLPWRGAPIDNHPQGTAVGSVLVEAQIVEPSRVSITPSPPA